MGNDDKISIPIKCNDSNKKDLQKKIDSGEINYEASVCQSIFTSSVENHKDILDNWIESYGEKKDVKSKLKNLKNADSGDGLKGSIIGTLADKEGKKVTLFVLYFTKKTDNKRKYFEASATVELTSDTAKELVRKHAGELAALVLSGGSGDYTLSITKE